MGSGEPVARPSTWHDALFRLRGWLVIAIAVVLFLSLVATRGWQRPIRRDTFAAAPIVAAGIAIRVWARLARRSIPRISSIRHGLDRSRPNYPKT